MDANLFEILACPVCKGKLILDKKHNELICKTDHLAFPIREDIPVMLEPEARRLNNEEINQVIHGKK